MVSSCILFFFLVVISIAITVVVVFSFRFSSKMAVSTFLRSVTSPFEFFNLKCSEPDLHDSSNCLNNVAFLLKPSIFQVSGYEFEIAFSSVLVECHILPGQPGQCPH